jgi:tetratricopeptide (TPR) repeat protein
MDDTDKQKKELPDLAKLGNARPTKIPKLAKAPEELVAAPKVHWRRFYMFFAALALLVVAIYSVTIWGGAVLDDQSHVQYVAQGLMDTNFWTNEWSKMIAHPLSQGWITLTYAWDVTSLPWMPAWSHAVNMGFQVLTCLYLYCFVFRVCWRLKNDQRSSLDPYFTAFAAAALLAIHPLCTGAVSYISGRPGSLVALNYFLTLNCFLLGYASESIVAAFSCYIVCCLFMAIGMLCDPRAITIPISIIVIGLLLKPQRDLWKVWFPERGIELSFFLLAAFVMPITLIMGGQPSVAKVGVDVPLLPQLSYCATQFKAIVSYYIRCAIVPFGLSIDPPYILANSFSDPLSIAGIAIGVAASAMSWIYRKNVLVSFGLCLFVLGMLPTVFLVQPQYIDDQRYFLSLAGLCIVAAWGMGELYNKDHKHAIAASVGLLLMFGGLNIWRSVEWRSENALWKQAVMVNPDSVRANMMYARSLQSAGKTDKAAQQIEKTLKLDPNNALALQISAQSKIAKKDYSAAIPILQQAIELQTKAKEQADRIAPLQRDLAICYVNSNQFDQAVALAQKAQIGLPDDPELHLIVGKGQLKKKSFKEAFLQLAAGLEQDRENQEFYLPLAEAALDSEVTTWYKYALSTAQRAFAIKNTRDSALLFARAALATGKPGMAIRALAKYSGEQNNDAVCTYVSAVAMHSMSGPDQSKAEAIRARALRLDPNVAQKVKLYIAPSSIPLSNVRTRPDLDEHGVPIPVPPVKAPNATEEHGAVPPVSGAASAPQSNGAATAPTQASSSSNTNDKAAPTKPSAR